jgi:hypothetical protein
MGCNSDLAFTNVFEKASRVRAASERLSSLEQLETDGLMNEEKYNPKRKKILEEL